MKQVIYLALLVIGVNPVSTGQTVSSSLPTQLDTKGRYLFYLHGGVVSIKGNNAINDAAPQWGPYEYLDILDSLSARGFYVISEIRKQNSIDSVYALRITSQADTLLRAGISPSNIIVLGASSGWGIGLLVSSMLLNSNVNYVMMGGCWPGTYKDFEGMKLYGRFLSLIEMSDPHGTCKRLLKGREDIRWEEITLHTGLSHGFFYKGRKEWIDPVVAWFEKK
jgi:hypothetical protein